MKKIIVGIIFLSISAIFIYQLIIGKTAADNRTEKPYVMINGQPVKVLIADEIREYVQGLSGRESLCRNCGMLFIFPQKQIRSFWMKNMRFPIDIIWIADQQIVKIDKSLLPEGEAPANTYSSQAEVNFVLEVNAGFSDTNNIKVGDKITINI